MISRIGNDACVCANQPVRGVVRLPGSKSLTNRALLCAALTDGVSVLRGASLADDALRMIDGLRALGVRVDIGDDRTNVTVHGCHGAIPEADVELDAGHAGTAMRFLTALCCLGRGRYRVDGSQRMRRRPIGALVDTLRALGAGVGYAAAAGFPPVTIVARGLDGGNAIMSAPPSSQFVSAVLMVAPYAARDVLLSVEGKLPSRSYVEMTMAFMRSLGVEVLASPPADSSDARFVVPATQRYRPGPIPIEPDASAASYFWAAAAITGGRVTIGGLSRESLQGDVGFVALLEQMGCTATQEDTGLTVAAPEDGRLRGIAADLNEMPDTAQTLAVTALFAEGPTTIRNVANLRVKETDRISALHAELTKLGARVDVAQDGLTITPPEQIRSATIDTYDDHRMAMSFALAGLGGAAVTIRDADCVAKSFPDFWDALGHLLAL